MSKLIKPRKPSRRALGMPPPFLPVLDITDIVRRGFLDRFNPKSVDTLTFPAAGRMRLNIIRTDTGTNPVITVQQVIPGQHAGELYPIEIVPTARRGGKLRFSCPAPKVHDGQLWKCGRLVDRLYIPIQFAPKCGVCAGVTRAAGRVGKPAKAA